MSAIGFLHPDGALEVIDLGDDFRVTQPMTRPVSMLHSILLRGWVRVKEMFHRRGGPRVCEV